ncbi:MAG: bifunctional phosphopantothenoylcysteine decarboxylase/phosphopantothenate--cysteine ligase CoaBC [Bacteroidota bacterium]
MLAGKKIILGISGGIAAYKTLFLIRLLKKAGAEVRVVATKNAFEFVTKVTLETLSKEKVYSDVFASENDYSTEHVSLTDWGDVLVVAPATGNIIGKFAHAIADDALSTTFLAFDKPVFIAPAMNTKMYQNPAMLDAINLLRQRKINIIEPTEGMLACGYEGKGRMEEPEMIFDVIKKHFSEALKFHGNTVLLTAGPTIEPIDPVRFISNHSSGFMGYSLANEFANQGANVILISGPLAKPIPVHSNIKKLEINTAKEMLEAVSAEFNKVDICIMAAAVADYTPVNLFYKKIKKKTDTLNLKLTSTTDILKEMGEKKKNQILVGFALETDNEIKNAIKKLHTKNLDFIVLNSLKDEGAGFGTSTNKITIIDRNENKYFYPLKQKSEVASDIINFLFDKYINLK